MATRVLVTGVRAKTGAPAARLLVERGVAVRGGSSDPGRVHAPGVEPVRFDWDDEATWGPALDGADGVFLVREDHPDAPERTAALVATTAPGTHVVLLSETAQERYAADAWASRVEAAVRDGGRPWTVLRPGWFMQVFSDPRFFRDDLREHGRLVFPGGGSRLAWVDAEDIAAVGVAALTQPGHDGLTHVVSGPEALTLPETAAALAAYAGREVEHVEVGVDEAAAGTEGFERTITVDTFERVARGEFAEVTDTVERVTGRAPTSLVAWAARAGGEG